MRLINTRSLVLEEYFGDQIPKYAILSHAWTDEEVTYQDWQHGDRRYASKGFRKIQAACLMSQQHSLEYLWVDTNCINKDSSAELSEAINSMFSWYGRSSTCFVYLDDFYYDSGGLAGFESSRWFTRGWTLQELLAPNTVQFFDASWTEFGTRETLMSRISKATSIQMQYLLHPDSIRLATVARKMSWIATRSTTREEDMAYCLLGLFGINMPLLYGEGNKAFIRLQEEIIRHSNEHTIFCWAWPPSMESYEPLEWQGCLAPSPIAFRDSGIFVPTHRVGLNIPSNFQLTNSGLHINLPLLYPMAGNSRLAVLNAKDPRIHDTQLCLYLHPLIGEEDSFTLARSNFPNRLLSVTIPRPWANGGTQIYLAHERDPCRKISTILTQPSIPLKRAASYAILPVSSAHLHNTYDVIRLSGNTQGAIIPLEPGDEENIWCTQLTIKLAKGTRLKIDFKARITQLQDGAWEVMTQVRKDGVPGKKETQAAPEKVFLSQKCEFSIESCGTPTLVRPVWISLSKFQTPAPSIPIRAR